MTISNDDLETMTGADFENILTTSNNYINFTLDTEVTADQAVALIGISSGTIVWSSIQDELANLADENGISQNLTDALAADSTVNIVVVEAEDVDGNIPALETENNVLAVNEIVQAIDTLTNSVTATFSITAEIASNFSFGLDSNGDAVVDQPLTISISDGISVGAFNTLDLLTDQDITLDGGLKDNIGNLVDDDGSITDGVTNALAQNGALNVEIDTEITSSTTSGYSEVSILAADITGSITGTITGSAADLEGITGLDSDDDSILFTIEPMQVSIK